MSSAIRSWVRSSLWLLPLGIAACSGCSDSGPTAPPDRGSPLIEIRFPASVTVVDRDSNGLVDFEVAFDDSLSGIDVASIEVLANRPLKGPAGQGANLIEVWRVQRADTTGFVLEETVDDLLPRGQTSLTVAVRDRAGNRVSRMLSVELPPAARHKVIDLQTDTFINASQVAVSPDGRFAFVAIDRRSFGSVVAIVDLLRLEWVRNLSWPVAGLSEMLVDPARGRLYIGSFLEPQVAVLDLATQMFLAPIAISARGIGMALSQQRSELYIGLEVEGGESTGFISVVDVDQGSEIRVIDLGITSRLNPGITMGMNALALDATETILFATTPDDVAEGILVIDPIEGRLLGQVDMAPEVPDEFAVFLAGARDLVRNGIELVATGSNYATGMGGRVVVFPIDDPERMRFGATEGQFLFPRNLAIAPDGTEWAMTAFNNPDLPHEVLLMDASSLDVVWRDQMPLGASSPFGIAFRPDGNVLVTAGNLVDPFPAPPQQAHLFVCLHR
ncbi:MAG: YncE family protein [Gemmatimonadota bacterium]